MDDDRPTIRIPAFRCSHTGRTGRCPFNTPIAGGKCDLHAREERSRQFHAAAMRMWHDRASGDEVSR